MAALFAARMLTYPLLLVIATLGSAVSGFLGSATDAMLRSIIGVRDYSKALSLNRGRDATISIAGNPVGGFLYGVAPWLPFLVTACLYALSGAAARRMRPPRGRRSSATLWVDGRGRCANRSS